MQRDGPTSEAVHGADGADASCPAEPLPAAAGVRRPESVVGRIGSVLASERAAPWVFGGGVLLVWEGACRGLGVPQFILPAPTAIAAALANHGGVILEHAWRTLWTTIVGFLMGVAVGVALGAAIASFRWLRSALSPVLVAFNALPKAAFLPILVVWFGLGTAPAIVTACVICFFPIVVNVATGLTTVEPELSDVLRSLGASRWDILTKVGMPNAFPYFFAALKVAITLAFVGTVVAEMSASNEGIGYLMMSASASMRMGIVFAGLIVIAAMAMAMYHVTALLERRFAGWATRGSDILS